MASNTTIGNYRISRRDNLDHYDRLPAALREVLARAPYDYAVPPFVKITAGLSPVAARRKAITLILADMALYVGKTWGPDHPQASPAAEAAPHPLKPAASRPSRTRNTTS